MAVYYKFKSAKDFDSIPIDGHFISVANLKERIFEVKHLGRGTDFDLMVSNAQTNEEYADEAMLIPKNTSVLIRRVPGRPRKPIVAAQEEPKPEAVMFDNVPTKSDVPIMETSATRMVEEPEWDEFGNDLYDIPEAAPIQSAVPIVNTFAPSMVDEESKIKAFVDTNALDWQRQIQETAAAGRGFGRGMGGRMMGGRGLGRGMGSSIGGGMMRKTPPQGYVCHRCNIPGHFIQHCPTNGDPNYDIKRVKPPTGIPKSMLMATPDGSYALPSGAVAVMKPNEAAFEREIEGLPSARPVTEFPPELRCPLCSNVMKDAVLTSKCCFSSFCDKCIRDYIISKGMCVCGATHILADDLVPNKTVRVTISHILESTTSSADNAGSMQQIQDMESALPGVVKGPSPTQSATSKEGSKGILLGKEEEDTGGAADAGVAEPPPETREMSQESGEKAVSSDPGKKKKKKKARLPGAGEMQPWLKGYPEMESYPGMMPIGGPFNPVFPGAMPWGMDGFLGPMPGHSLMGFPPHGPLDMPPYPYAPGLLMPPPLLPLQQPLDMSEMGGPNRQMPRMGRSEAEKQKGEMRRGRESERRPERGHSRDRDRDRDSRSRHRTDDRGERFTRSGSSHGPSSDWAEQSRSGRSEKDEKSSRASGSERPEKTSRSGDSDRPEKSSRSRGSDRPDKSSRKSAERPEKSSRTSLDRPEKSSRTSAERPEKSRRTSAERPEKSRRASSDLPEKSGRIGSDRPEKKSRTSGSDRTEKSGGMGSSDRPEKSSGTGGSDQPDKSSRTSALDRPEKGNGTRDLDRSEKSGGTSGLDRAEKSSRTKGSDRSERSSRSSKADREKSSRTNGLDQEKKAEEVEVLPPPPPLPASMAPPSSDRKQKGSVFSRISFPESGKKRTAEEKRERNKSSKGSSSSSAGGSAPHAGASEERESDDDYHFKRRPAAARGENEKEIDVQKGSSKSSGGNRDRRSKRR